MSVAPQDLAAQLARAGLPLREIADETGLSYDATRAALRRRGMRAVPLSEVDVRQRAEGMPLREAVDYLLGVVEDLLDTPARKDHATDAWGVFTACEQRIVRALHDARGRFMSRSQLVSATYFDRTADDVPEDKIIDVYVCKIRKKLPSGVVIETRWGRGWRLLVEHRPGGAEQ